ncbi:MAG: tRNA 2-thiouridine(34) synthase MnmA [Hyphomicrobium sp.]|nr:tRNA 2-thiouridine(34) synthase MnmA [Hyphomicrobium sp.]
MSVANLDPARLGRLHGVADGARVVVAMSGGVDSSLAAALAKAAGYDVVGITLQLYDHGAATGRKGACCAGQDIHDARRVAEHLGIAHYVLDYERRFRDAVIAPFAESYLAGETPIPCVSCNQNIKFSGLLDTAREIGAAALITGHYVDWRFVDGQPTLYRPADLSRDQSYFLFATTRDELAFLRFPLGALLKSEVRELARAFALPVAEKADSQDICFVPQGRYSDVIERLRPEAATPGNVVHVDGRVLGRHDGIMGFTVGQRRGLGVTGREPLYVVRLDASRAEVVVGPRDCLRVRTIMLKDVNWLGDQPVDGGGAMRERVSVRVRSSQDPMSAHLSLEGRAATVVLDDGEFGVAPGQACVFYSSETAARVLGGGWIASTSADIDKADFGAALRTAETSAGRRTAIAAGPGN